MSRSERISLSGLVFVIVSAFVGALVYRYTNKVAAHLEANFGYVADPEATREFLRELDRPTFREAGADAIKQAKNVDTFLYRQLDRAHKAAYGTPWVCWNQGNAGTCVSFAFALASQTAQAVDWSIGRLPKPPQNVATEPIYGGSRTAGRLPPISYNPGGDGSYGGAASRWISGQCKQPNIGGILFRKPYGSVDLTTYSIPLSREWGARGVPLELAKEAHQNCAMHVANVTDWESLVASVESGFAVVLCSNVGYGGTTVRDADGFLPRGSSWSHAMCVVAVRHAKNAGEEVQRPRDGALIQNSWSERWCSGPKWPADQPDGSFWAERKNVEAALAQGDCWAVGGVAFKYRDLNNGEWMAPVKVDSLSEASEGAGALAYQLGL